MSTQSSLRRGPTNTNADALSRLPVLAPDTDVPVPAELVLLIEHISTGPLTASLIKNLTHRDPVLSPVHSRVQSMHHLTLSLHVNTSYQFVMVAYYGAIKSSFPKLAGNVF